MRKFICVLFLFFACVWPMCGREGGARVGASGKVSFFEYEKKDGALLWELRAKSATPDGGQEVALSEAGHWLLSGVELDYLSNGKVSATLQTPDCRYDKGGGIASSPNEMKMHGEGFRVRGRGWRWEHRTETDPFAIRDWARGFAALDWLAWRVNGGYGDIVELHNQVAVTFTASGAHDGIHVFSRSLKILKGGGADGRTVFLFSGEVKAVMEPKDKEKGDLLLYSDTLIVRLKETDIRVLAGVAEDTQAKTPGGVALAPPEKPAPGGTGGRPDFEKLEDIVAAGGVRITSQARQISGNISRYDQATQTFTTSGNTRVDDFAQRVNVQGGRIVNNTTTGKIDVFRHEDGVPVVLQTPSFLRGEGKGGQGGGAIVTGGHLIISSPEEAINLIEMTGDVRAKDEGLIINSEKITVETPRGSVSKFTTPGDSGQADARVNRIFAEKDVRAIHEGRLLNCGKVEILPGQGEGEYDMELYENPVLSGRGAQLLGHRIKMHSSKVEGSEAQLSATVESAPGVAPERQRARVTLPPLNPLRSGQDAVPDDPLEQAPTVVDSDVLVMTELPGDLAEFNFTGNVVLLGTGLDGRCDRMDILADAKGDTNGSTSMARIHNITAVGNARFETEAYIARGGEAVLLPSVALRESSAPGGNGGKNGGATQFFTLKPHASTPGVRPHLTFKKASGVDFGGFPGAPSSDTSALKEQAGPIDMESDLLEILGDSVRSRFFMRGDVALSGPGMNGRCANVEGYIAQGGTSAATRSGARPGYDITRIIGREDVRFDVNGRKASGQMFEMFPQKHELYLSGNPVVNTGGITATGGERIRYNWLTKQWDMDAGSRAGAGVSRPVIIIPRRGSNWSSPRK